MCQCAFCICLQLFVSLGEIHQKVLWVKFLWITRLLKTIWVNSDKMFTKKLNNQKPSRIQPSKHKMFRGFYRRNHNKTSWISSVPRCKRKIIKHIIDKDICYGHFFHNQLKRATFIEGWTSKKKILQRNFPICILWEKDHWQIFPFNFFKVDAIHSCCVHINPHGYINSQSEKGSFGGMVFSSQKMVEDLKSIL